MSKITPSKNAIVYIITTIITAVSLSTGAGTVVSTVPDSPDPSASYLFYLHGRGVDMGHSGAKKAYHKNVEALSKQGFVVVSEARRKDAIKKFCPFKKDGGLVGDLAIVEEQVYVMAQQMEGTAKGRPLYHVSDAPTDLDQNPHTGERSRECLVSEATLRSEVAP